jgi:hypothetical protein
MAAIRFDGMPDRIEKVLYSSLMDRTVPDPSLQNTFMGAKLDPLASDTWEEVTVGECVLSNIYACLLVCKCNAFSFTRLCVKLVSHNNQI